jgi:hypothetical protein
VRRSLADEQAAAKIEGRTVGNSEAIIAVAEQMLPAVRESIWLDRAEAAVAMLDTVTLRDLRSTVAAAAPRDEIGRELLSKLREALTTRVNKLRSGWEEEITKALDEDRVVQALRLSARPPEPTTRFPAALVERLVAAAGAGMSSTVPKDRWLALLEAASNSPVRRSIHPEGLPADADGAVRQAATEAAGRIPALAKLLGLAMPPPPRPMGQRPLPPRPARPARPATEASSTAAPAVEEAPNGVSDVTVAATPAEAEETAPAEAPPAEAPPAEAVQSEAVQSEAVQSEAVQSEAVQSETATSGAIPADAVASELSSESDATMSEQPDEAAEAAAEPEQSTSEPEPANDFESPVASEEAEGDLDAAASAVLEQSDATDTQAAPEADLVEPLDNAVPIEPVTETLGQGEES